ncbi:hypothetical protein D3Z50_15300 [Clostridiaceae bacterium]|nr:hypothetical protein [Clostridiaceae bacterium]
MPARQADFLPARLQKAVPARRTAAFRALRLPAGSVIRRTADAAPARAAANPGIPPRRAVTIPALLFARPGAMPPLPAPASAARPLSG